MLLFPGFTRLKKEGFENLNSFCSAFSRNFEREFGWRSRLELLSLFLIPYLFVCLLCIVPYMFLDFRPLIGKVLSELNSILPIEITILNLRIALPFLLLLPGLVILCLFRKQLEKQKEIEDSFMKSQAIIRAIPDLIFQLNQRGDILSYKGALQDLYEAPEYFVERNVKDVLPPDAADTTLKNINKALSSGEMVIYDYQLRIRNNSRYFECRLVPVKKNNVLGIVRNITEQKLAEEAITWEKERLAVTLHAIGDGVISTDTRGDIILLNRIAEEITEWTEAEAIGRPINQVISIIDTESQKIINDPATLITYHDENKDINSRTVLITKNNDEKYIDLNCALMYRTNGELVGVVMVFRDVTQTLKMQESLVRAQKLEAAGRLAGEIAHDFNNLLGPLVAYPDFIRNKLPEDHPGLKYLQIMEQSALQMAEINQELLTLARRGHYSQEPFDLNGIIAQVIESIDPFPADIIIETNLASNLDKVKGGASQISRVILNVVKNAVDAMGTNGGKLTIKTENFEVNEVWRKYNKVPEGEYVKLTVSDTGCGIPQKLQHEIFEPFFTTKSADGLRGTGLGLSVVYNVVEDHNAFLDFSSRTDEGTSFYLYFPPTEEQAECEEEEKKFAGGSEKILVVDDNPIQRSIIVETLREYGYRLTSTGDPNKALKFLSGDRFDLLILDMRIYPEIDGAEIYRRALEFHPQQKAIILSGYADSDRIKDVFELGAVEYLKKPFTVNSILKTVRNSLDNRTHPDKRISDEVDPDAGYSRISDSQDNSVSSLQVASTADNNEGLRLSGNKPFNPSNN